MLLPVISSEFPPGGGTNFVAIFSSMERVLVHMRHWKDLGEIFPNVLLPFVNPLGLWRKLVREFVPPPGGGNSEGITVCIITPRRKREARPRANRKNEASGSWAHTGLILRHNAVFYGVEDTSKLKNAR